MRHLSWVGKKRLTRRVREREELYEAQRPGFMGAMSGRQTETETENSMAEA